MKEKFSNISNQNKSRKKYWAWKSEKELEVSLFFSTSWEKEWNGLTELKENK